MTLLPRDTADDVAPAALKRKASEDEADVQVDGGLLKCIMVDHLSRFFIARSDIAFGNTLSEKMSDIQKHQI